MPTRQHEELLPIVVQENNVLIDARLLHQKLKAGTKFTEWIKNRIVDYVFEENKDYFRNFGKSTTKPTHEYLLSLDMAKELAMLERNETGRQIRRYFIAKEKQLRGISTLPKQNELFKGLQPKNVNGRKLFNYRSILERAGYSLNLGGSRRARYPQHFVLMGHELLITEDFALHLYHQKQVFNNRAVLKEMQPVLPLNFGEPLNEKGGVS